MHLLDLGIQSRESILEAACEVLNAGKLLIFPTDTVYGLLGDFQREETIKSIYRVKHRSHDMPLILLGDSLKQLLPYVSVPQIYRALLNRWNEQYWPGSLTVILPKSPAVPPWLVGDKLGVGIRVPAHDLLLELLQMWQKPLASTSANISRKPPIRSGREGLSFFRHEAAIDLIVEQGELGGNQPSTIVDLTHAQPQILRQGKTLIDIVKFRNETDPT